MDWRWTRGSPPQTHCPSFVGLAPLKLDSYQHQTPTENFDSYIAIQSTKPCTLRFALKESPVALLAWTYEKLVGWSDNYRRTDDEVLTGVSICYFSVSGPESSSYLYYEIMHDPKITPPVVQGYIDVLLGLADFPVKINNTPRAWWSTLRPVVYSKSYDNRRALCGLREARCPC